MFLQKPWNTNNFVFSLNQIKEEDVEMPIPKEQLTSEYILSLFKDIAQQFKETKELLSEKFKETDKQFKETDRKLKLYTKSWEVLEKVMAKQPKIFFTQHKDII